MIKRHTRPNPAKNIAGGISEQRGGDPHLQRDARRPGPQRPDADRPPAGRRGQSASASPRRAARSSPRRDGQRKRKTNMAARLKEQVREGSRPGAQEGVRDRQRRWRCRGSRRSSSTWGSARPSPTRRCSTAPPRSCRPIAGQRAVVTKAKKSIATFKLRDRHADRRARHPARRPDVGVPRPAHQHRAAARARLPRRVDARRSTAAGNYTLGVRDHFIFPEIDYAKTDKSKGLNVTIVTTAGRDDRAKALLRRARHAVRQSSKDRNRWPHARCGSRRRGSRSS